MKALKQGSRSGCYTYALMLLLLQTHRGGLESVFTYTIRTPKMLHIQ